MIRNLFRAPSGPTPPAQRSTYCYLGNERAIALTHRGHKLFLDLRDVGMTPHLALSGEWERNVEAVAVGLLQPGQTVVEVGANMGYHTLAMAQAIGPEGHIHAFEVHPRILPLLRDTIEINGYAGRVTVHANAALDRDGMVDFAAHPTHSGSGHVTELADVPGYSDRFAAIAVRLDGALAALPELHLLRMDCEGSEVLVMRGAEQLIRRSRTLVVMMEWDRMLMAPHIAGDSFEAWLRELGFVHVYLIEGSAAGRLRKLPAGQLGGFAHCDLVLARAPLPATSFGG